MRNLKRWHVYLTLALIAFSILWVHSAIALLNKSTIEVIIGWLMFVILAIGFFEYILLMSRILNKKLIKKSNKVKTTQS